MGINSEITTHSSQSTAVPQKCTTGQIADINYNALDLNLLCEQFFNSAFNNSSKLN